MVEYDSIIPPGQAGKLIQQVKLDKAKSGPFTKSVTVTSNAKNIENLKLSITTKILTDIHLSHRFIHLKPDTSGKFAGLMTMSTEKKDFYVKEISFEQKNNKDAPEWQLGNDIMLQHTMTSSDTADEDGYFTYTLHFSCNITPPKEMLSGSFIFKTNHPKQETIKLRGMINPKKD